MDRIDLEGGTDWLKKEWLDFTLDQMLWERVSGLFSGIAIGVLTAIFVIGPSVGGRLFWESPVFVIFAVILGVLVLFQLRVILLLRRG